MYRVIIATQERNRKEFLIYLSSYIYVKEKCKKKGEKKQDKNRDEWHHSPIDLQYIWKKDSEKNVIQKCQEMGQRDERSIKMVT